IAHCHNRCSSAWVYSHHHLVKFLLSGGDAKTNKICFQSWYHYFCFRVAHPAIVFDNKGIAVDIDQAKENKPGVFYAFFINSVDGWFDDPFLYFMHKAGCSERNRADGSHSASIQTRIS